MRLLFCSAGLSFGCERPNSVLGTGDDLRGEGPQSRSWYGVGLLRRLKAILRGFDLEAGGADVIPVDLLIKDSPQTCGHTDESN